MATELRIRLLGGLDVALEDARLTDFVSNKVPALLAYLAVTRRPHQREALAGLLWGERAEADARNNLRQALSNLRQLLAPFLMITRDSVALDPSAAVGVDVLAFEEHFRAGGGAPLTPAGAARLSEAAALYQGDFLAGLAVRDAPEFEDWMLAQRSRLRELALHTLHTLTQWHMVRGEAAAAIDTATRLLSIEAWREEVYRQLMLALARSGQRSAALAQYELCRRVLDKELAVTPSSETTALFQRIQAARRQVRLPSAATPFVGRAAELAEIAALMADPTCRLITLSGPGGCGKTRLAQEAAARAADAFLHGVCFVPLAGAGALEVAPSTVAEALGLALSGKIDPRDQLRTHLRDKEVLLVLDNLEHLPGAGEWVADLVEACPDVRLMVTSRERLNLYGERLFEVGGLEAPPAPDTAGYSAAQLFVNAARAAQPGFQPEAQAAAVGRICRLVDGHPLALELAATWVRQLTCQEIADEIERNLGFLATAQTNVPARHRSLPAAFEHSWNLLIADERRAFARLAVFSGGCEREAALAVAQGSLPILAALCDKSLLRRDPAGRYGLHELLRQYAQDKLSQDPQQAAEVQAQHCAYFVAFAGARQDALGDARQAAAQRELAAEMNNVRAAWSWAVTSGRPALLQPALEALRIFLEHQGWYAEALRLFETAAEAERTAAGDSPCLAQLLVRCAWFQHRLDRFEAARPLLERALPILRAAQPPLPADVAFGLMCLGNISRAVGDFASALGYYQQCLSLYRAGGDPREIAFSLNGLATAHAELGLFAEAERLHLESLALRRELGDRRGVATGLANLGFIALGQARYADAKAYSREAVGVFRELAYPMGVAVTLNNWGVACQMLGEYTEARACLQECLALCQEVGHRHIAAHALASLGGVAGALGDHHEAWQHTRTALQTAREIHSLSATLFGLVSAAGLLGRPGASQPAAEQAAELAALVLHHPATNQENKDRAARLMAGLEARWPAARLAAAQAQGRARSPEDAADDLLLNAAPPS
ncbi:MAG: tetratricopeptide repeat protein [Anaerolineales bacterium]|nr:tetratricopeptide repeat protein [Anaerolineales bacterium]